MPFCAKWLLSLFPISSSRAYKSQFYWRRRISQLMSVSGVQMPFICNETFASLTEAAQQILALPQPSMRDQPTARGSDSVLARVLRGVAADLRVHDVRGGGNCGFHVLSALSNHDVNDDTHARRYMAELLRGRFVPAICRHCQLS